MTALKLTFAGDASATLGGELKQRVAADLAARGISGKANAAMWIRTVVMLGTTATAYGLIMSGLFPPLAMLGLAMLMGVGIAGIGFCVAHDALHGAYSTNPRVNRLIGWSLDLIGGSSYLWNLGHNVVHHTYTNIPGVDGDVAGSSLLRQSPSAPWRPCHRYQHIYAFPLYSLATLNWVFLKDYKGMFQRNWGTERDKVHPRADIRRMLALKAFYYTWSLVLPLTLLAIPWWQVMIGYVAMHLTAGSILGVVFQLAHIVEGTTFPRPDATGTVRESWIAHELATTANFANGNRLLTWYIGGLNYQIEHHLFPRVCSVHYPSIAGIVREMAEREGLPYQHQPTLLSAVRSHVRLLKKFGQGTAPVRATADVAVTG
jgi:linoleoyl-CoA desaturase